MNITDISVILKTQGLKLLAGLAVVGIGFSIIHWVMNIIRKHVKKLPIDPTLENFLNNIIRLVLYLIVILTGCTGTKASEPTPTPSATPAPTATAKPSATPTPSPTSRPTRRWPLSLPCWEQRVWRSRLRCREF